MFVVVHNIIPHHHHHNNSHEIAENCMHECDTELENEAHNHTPPEHCHAFNNIELHNKKDNQQNIKQKNTDLLLLSLNQQYALQCSKIRFKTKLILKPKSISILQQFLRGPPSIKPLQII